MDVEIVQHFNTHVLCVNEEGKRGVQASTLFFMPHCGFSLYICCYIVICRYNSLIWKNWGESIQFLTLIGNRFSCYDNMMIEEEKRNSPSNCVLPILPYLTEFPISLNSQVSHDSKASQSSDRLVFDSFHSTALEFVTPSQFKAAESDGLWERKPSEPELGDDATSGISEEVVSYLERLNLDDSIWTDVMNGYAETPNRRILMLFQRQNRDIQTFLKKSAIKSK